MHWSPVSFPVVGSDSGPCRYGAEENQSKERGFTGAPHARKVNPLSKSYPYLTKMQKSVNIGDLPTPKEEVTKLLVSDSRSRTVKYLSVESVRRFFREIPRANLRDRLLFDLIYHYGLRRTEAARISTGDFDFTADTFEVRRLKGGESKPYPLFPGTKRLLRQYLDIPRVVWTRHLFQSRQRIGQPISASLVAMLFHRYAEAAGIPADRAHVHVLRHSIAMHMIESGIGVLDVKDWLGHASITSTQVYVEISPRRRTNNLKKMVQSKEIA
jgi:site-specific recombinase XerD